MSFFKADTWFDVFKHLTLIAALGGALVLGFFYVYLPLTTHHGETIVVPKITGMNAADLTNYLGERKLSYFVDDSSYAPGVRAFTVLTQEPAPGEKVKQDRKIYLSVAMRRPPVIKMPKLTDGSVKNAQLILQSYDLQIGQIKLVPNVAQNAVLRQLSQGRDIAPGAPIAKGSRIDLEVGDGLGNTEFAVPSLLGMPEDEARTLLAGQHLEVGEVFKQAADNGQTPGTVVRQRPVAALGALIRTGQLVDLWVAE